MRFQILPVSMLFTIISYSLTACTTSKNIPVNTQFTSQSPITDLTNLKADNNDKQNLFDKLKISKAQFRDIVLSHAPAQFQNNDVDYHILTDGISYVIYVSNEKIPPRPNLSLGNWTNNPLYVIELDSQLKFRKEYYVR